MASSDEARSAQGAHRPLLDVRAAGTYTGLGERYIRRLRAERRIACIRIGGRIMFDPDDLDRFIDGHRQPAIAADRRRPHPAAVAPWEQDLGS